MTAIALCVIYIGVSGMLKGENTLVLIVSMVLGTAVGTLFLDLDGRIERLGGRLERRFQRGGRAPIAEGLRDSLFAVLRGCHGDSWKLQCRIEAGL